MTDKGLLFKEEILRILPAIVLYTSNKKKRGEVEVRNQVIFASAEALSKRVAGVGEIVKAIHKEEMRISIDEPKPYHILAKTLSAKYFFIKREE